MAPKKKTGLDMIKKYWWVILFVFGIGGWVFMVEFSIASGEKKDTSQDADISEITKVLQSNNALLQKMDSRMSNLESNFELILEVVGIKVNDSLKNHWKSMPRSLPIDQFGNPVLGGEWLVFSDKYLLATKYKWIDEDSLEYSVQWDKRPEIETR